jgi:hypothetical protein
MSRCRSVLTAVAVGLVVAGAASAQGRFLGVAGDPGIA